MKGISERPCKKRETGCPSGTGGHSAGQEEGHADLKLPASRAVRRKPLCFTAPACGDFVRAAQTQHFPALTFVTVVKAIHFILSHSFLCGVFLVLGGGRV